MKTKAQAYTYDQAEREAAQRIEQLRGKDAADCYFSDCTLLSDLVHGDTDESTFTDEQVAAAVTQFVEWFDAL